MRETDSKSDRQLRESDRPNQAVRGMCLFHAGSGLVVRSREPLGTVCELHRCPTFVSVFFSSAFGLSHRRVNPCCTLGVWWIRCPYTNMAVAQASEARPGG